MRARLVPSHWRESDIHGGAPPDRIVGVRPEFTHEVAALADRIRADLLLSATLERATESSRWNWLLAATRRWPLQPALGAS